MRQAQKRPLTVRYVGSRVIERLEIGDQATIADLRAALQLEDGLYYFAAAKKRGQRLDEVRILADEEARIAEVLQPGEELLVARRAILG